VLLNPVVLSNDITLGLIPYLLRGIPIRTFLERKKGCASLSSFGMISKDCKCFICTSSAYRTWYKDSEESLSWSDLATVDDLELLPQTTPEQPPQTAVGPFRKDTNTTITSNVFPIPQPKDSPYPSLTLALSDDRNSSEELWCPPPESNYSTFGDFWSISSLIPKKTPDGPRSQPTNSIITPSVPVAPRSHDSQCRLSISDEKATRSRFVGLWPPLTPSVKKPLVGFQYNPTITWNIRPTPQSPNSQQQQHAFTQQQTHPHDQSPQTPSAMLTLQEELTTAGCLKAVNNRCRKTCKDTRTGCLDNLCRYCTAIMEKGPLGDILSNFAQGRSRLDLLTNFLAAPERPHIAQPELIDAKPSDSSLNWNNNPPHDVVQPELRPRHRRGRRSRKYDPVSSLNAEAGMAG
jgi:hypothetical protein